MKLATALHDGARAQQDAARRRRRQPPRTPPPIDLDTATIDSTLGRRARRTAASISSASRAPSRSRTAAWKCQSPWVRRIAINFQPTGGGKAAITGDFVLTAKEVNPVLRALRDNGIEVTALHNHMLDEQPRLFFMHFWANDDAQKLAEGLRAALDNVHVAHPH